MRLNKAEIKRGAIRHYKRMIKCAKTFKGRFTIHNIKEYMLEEIEEHWSGKYCSYCNVYTEVRQTYSSSGYTVCGNCPLNNVVETLCGVHDMCCEGLHWTIMESKNLEEFIENLENVLKYIRRNG